MSSAQHIVRLKPIAVELIDRTMIELARRIPIFQPTLDRFVRETPEAILLVEFGEDDHEVNLRLLQQLKQFIFPLIALLVFGARKSDDGDPWLAFAPVIGIAVLVVLAILQYFTYRYVIGRDGLTVREGLLHRSRREIPFSRIHNVVVHQSLLHRVFGVAEVRLESAGGQKPEAQMRVLGLRDALALEDLVRHQARGPAATQTAAPDEASRARDATLLALSTAEVIRLGLISNRGMIVVE